MITNKTIKKWPKISEEEIKNIRDYIEKSEKEWKEIILPIKSSFLLLARRCAEKKKWNLSMSYRLLSRASKITCRNAEELMCQVFKEEVA